MSKPYRHSSEQSYFPLSPPAGPGPAGAGAGPGPGFSLTSHPADSSLDHLPAYDAPSSNSSKGKSRARGSFDDSTDDGMAWEPNASMTDGLASRNSDHAPNRRASNVGGFRDAARAARLDRYGTEEDQLERELLGVDGLGDSAAEKRRVSILWWRAAMVNVVFILAW